MKGRLTKLALRAADAVLRSRSAKGDPAEEPAHLARGREGEEAAYFYLREQGYVIVARNFRSQRCRGEIDLIGWDGDVLCFIEVKTRTGHTLVPAELAVDGPKRGMLRAAARDYLHRMKTAPAVRFDVISLYFHRQTALPEITLFKNAFPMA
jgi:putative endonuclease